MPDTLNAAYNRTKLLNERKAMKHLRADYLNKLKGGATMMPIHGSVA